MTAEVNKSGNWARKPVMQTDNRKFILVPLPTLFDHLLFVHSALNVYIYRGLWPKRIDRCET